MSVTKRRMHAAAIRARDERIAELERRLAERDGSRYRLVDRTGTKARVVAEFDCEPDELRSTVEKLVAGDDLEPGVYDVDKARWQRVWGRAELTQIGKANG